MVHGVGEGLAIRGAWIFLISRFLYVPEAIRLVNRSRLLLAGHAQAASSPFEVSATFRAKPGADLRSLKWESQTEQL